MDKDVESRFVSVGDAAVHGGAEAGGAIRRITAYSQNLSEYEGSKQTAGIRKTLSEIGNIGAELYGIISKGVIMSANNKRILWN
jgi:hypothetical protein